MKKELSELLHPSRWHERSGFAEHLEKLLKNLPTDPGVYQMKDESGKVIYVGKAKHLKNRVKSYFDRTSELTAAKKQMVARIRDIEIIICATEVEALVLETNLIKHLTPKYNILMKDDKNLAYIKITNSPVPELIKTRQKFKDGGEYFGPYVSWVEQSVRALRRIFKIRNCRMKFSAIPLRKGDPAKREGDWDIWISQSQSSVLAGSDSSFLKELRITDTAWKTIPCMDYYIWLCPAPCMLERDKMDNHTAHIQSAREFLLGKTMNVVQLMEEEMREKAKHLLFEDAAKIKVTIESLKWLSEKQKVRDIVEGNIDVFLIYEKYDKTYIALTQVRSSQVIGVFRHEVSLGADDQRDLMTLFLTKQYIDRTDLPDLLLTIQPLEDESFCIFLKEWKILHELPQVGPKNDLIKFTLNQLREYAYKREMASLENKTLTREHMVHVLERLWYNIPKNEVIVFECYDISHTDGHFTYASRVVIVNGKAETSRYKKYKIKTLEDGMIDDFASHREVMMRRTIEGLEQDNFPHLIIIDGGKWQLSSALSWMREWEWRYRHSEQSKESRSLDPLLSPQDDEQKYPPICSIAKREEEIFLPWLKDPILFEKWTPELMVLQKARDESHRFSITANRTARMKSMKKNILEEIPGIGPITRKRLLKLAGSVEEIQNTHPDELTKICTKTQIQTLRDHGLV